MSAVGQVTALDPGSGHITVRTTGGALDVTIPGLALQHLKQGDLVELDFALRRAR
jgi:hypothetical protein